jgi:sugar phosphate isomerase/epimerase
MDGFRFSPVLGASAALNIGAAADPITGFLDGAERIGASALYLGGEGHGRVLVKAPELLVARRATLRVAAIEAGLAAVSGSASAAAGTGGAFGLVPQAARAQAASIERDEADTAVTVTRAALALAVELGAPYVVLTLGSMRPLSRLWQKLRGRYLRGVLLYDDESARDFMAVRAGIVRRHLDAALRSLDRIVEDAQRRGVTVLLRNPRLPYELPTGIELAAIRAELRGAPLAPFLDVPAAHLLSMLHCTSLRETVLAFSDGPLCNLADACGQLSGLVPGQGEVDIPSIAKTLKKETARAFIPSPGLSPREIAEGCRAVLAA